jgi:hypothetical protein
MGSELDGLSAVDYEVDSDDGAVSGSKYSTVNRNGRWNEKQSVSDDGAREQQDAGLTRKFKAERSWGRKTAEKRSQNTSVQKDRC